MKDYKIREKLKSFKTEIMRKRIELMWTVAIKRHDGNSIAPITFKFNVCLISFTKTSKNTINKLYFLFFIIYPPIFQKPSFWCKFLCINIYSLPHTDDIALSNKIKENNFQQSRLYKLHWSARRIIFVKYPYCLLLIFWVYTE